MKKILELGTGKRPYLGNKNEKVIHLDIEKLSHIEAVHDLNKTPYPFKDNEFDEIIAVHVLEHLNDLVKVMSELWRIGKNDGMVKIWVPFFASPDAYTDPTHKRFFTLRTFDYWDDTTYLGNELGYEVGKARFKVMKRELHFLPQLKFFGKIFVKIPYVYQACLSRNFPAYEIYFELKVIKR